MIPQYSNIQIRRLNEACITRVLRDKKNKSRLIESKSISRIVCQMNRVETVCTIILLASKAEIYETVPSSEASKRTTTFGLNLKYHSSNLEKSKFVINL